MKKTRNQRAYEKLLSVWEYLNWMAEINRETQAAKAIVSGLKTRLAMAPDVSVAAADGRKKWEAIYKHFSNSKML